MTLPQIKQTLHWYLREEISVGLPPHKLKSGFIVKRIYLLVTKHDVLK